MIWIDLQIKVLLFPWQFTAAFRYPPSSVPLLFFLSCGTFAVVYGLFFTENGWIIHILQNRCMKVAVNLKWCLIRQQPSLCWGKLWKVFTLLFIFSFWLFWKILKCITQMFESHLCGLQFPPQSKTLLCSNFELSLRCECVWFSVSVWPLMDWWTVQGEPGFRLQLLGRF